MSAPFVSNYRATMSRFSGLISPRTVLCAALGSALAVLTLGCKKADMAEQPKYEPYDASMVFADGASARPLVAGTLARDPAANTTLVYGQPPVHTPDMSPVTSASESIPFPITRDVIQRGQSRYNIYCSVCHGRLGNGEGMIPQRGFITPPSYHTPRLVAEKDAHFYAVISNGYQGMYSYGDRIAPADRWCIVAYIRALQAAPELAPAPLTAEDKKAILGSGEATRGSETEGAQH